MINLPTGQEVAALDTRLWTLIDEHINELVQVANNTLGSSNPRPLTVVIPLANDVAPDVGWLWSVPVWFPSRIVAWEIHAITSGQITLDLRVSTIQPLQGTPPTFQSLNGASNYLTLDGYTVKSIDTADWAKRDISAGSIISVFVISASGIQEAVLALQLNDLQSNVLQR